MIDRTEEYEKMAAVESQLWWYRNLHQLSLKALLRFRFNKESRILDAGCGTGGLMSFLTQHGYNNISGIDLSPDAVAFCHQKKLKVVQDNVLNCNKHFEAESLDVIISNDVLCYFKEPEQIHLLERYATLLRNGGLLIMNLPALKAFSGIHDISVGIQHRFNRNDFRKVLTSVPLDLSYHRYWPFLMSPLIYAIRRKQRHALKEDNAEIVSDVYLPAAPINTTLNLITKAEITLIPPPPFGSSLFVVLHKKAK
jgi:SAM-dependent methyltransferase